MTLQKKFKKDKDGAPDYPTPKKSVIKIKHMKWQLRDKKKEKDL